MDKLKKLWRSTGPGLITGAADDDPSGIVTYAIAGAKFGLATLWMVLFTLPFMIIVQRMAGRIGLISGRGLAGNMKKHYPKWILIFIALLITIANIINIGADISGMAAASAMLFPAISPMIFSLSIGNLADNLNIAIAFRVMGIILVATVLILFMLKDKD